MNDLNKYLLNFVAADRAELLLQKILQRTRYVTIGLEDIYQSQNASAVLRTCEAFGVHDIHIIEDKNRYQINPKVVMGATKWLNLIKYEMQNPTLEAIKNLKQNGYRIVATSPHGNNTSLENFDLTKGKAAIFFGTELTGISDTIKDNADEFLTIPMYGFVESFNISVSAAITLYHLTTKLRQSEINWQLSQSEQDEILTQWLRATIRTADELIERFNNQKHTK